MMAHWQHTLKTKTIPAELSEQLKISEKEKSSLVKFAKSSGAGAAKRKRAYDAAARDVLRTRSKPCSVILES